MTSQPRAQAPLDGRAQRPVAVAVHLGRLEELAGAHARLELRRRQEEVVDAVRLAGPRRARGGRDGDPQVRDPAKELLHQGPFSGSGRAGDDEQMALSMACATLLAVARRVTEGLAEALHELLALAGAQALHAAALGDLELAP